MVCCYGGRCPLRRDCFRFTTPTPGRHAFGSAPYDPRDADCAEFISNLTPEAHLRARAYHIWQSAGRPEGQGDARWRQARAEADRSMGRAPVSESDDS